MHGDVCRWNYCLINNTLNLFSAQFIIRSVLELSLDESGVLLIVLTSSRPGP